MNVLVPNYYHKFKCIADKCKHNCCIGWEIWIDDETLSRYEKLGGEMGERIRCSIKKGEDTHFILGEDRRCPHLNEKGLCNIISELGEDCLCNICTDHPRFRSFYSDFTEEGLGLCCEEAARIIVNFKDKFLLQPYLCGENIFITEQEEFLLGRRTEIIEKLQNRDISIRERFCKLSNSYGFDFSSIDLKKLCNTYISLAKMDNKWTAILEKLKNYSFDLKIFDDKNFQIPFEQLACYFIFRHFIDAVDDGDIASKVKFAIYSCFLLGAVCSMHQENSGCVNEDDIAEYARMYSSEVEYSEENMRTIYDK